METKKRNLKEKLATMNNNVFVQNAAAIREICLKEDVDIGVGMDMWINNGARIVSREGYQEFRSLCKEFTLDLICEVLAE